MFKIMIGFIVKLILTGIFFASLILMGWVGIIFIIEFVDGVGFEDSLVYASATAFMFLHMIMSTIPSKIFLKMVWGGDDE